jgi:hypothetical protein
VSALAFAFVFGRIVAKARGDRLAGRMGRERNSPRVVVGAL